MAEAFDPIPDCFCKVDFLPIPRLERIVYERLNRFQKETKMPIQFPIDIETLVEVVEKIEVVFFDGEEEFSHDVLGAYDFTQRKLFIRETIDNVGRRRFTWAHEYGHFVLHSPHFLQQTFRLFDDSRESVGAVQLNRGRIDTRNKLEWQANQFASHILMPTHLIIEKLESMRMKRPAEDLVHQLSTIAEVSLQASRIRLEQMGWVPKNKF